MRKLHLLLFAFLLSSQLAFAQSSGINFQGIARNASGEPLVNQKISLRFAVIQSTESGTVEYQETKEVTSNGQGMFSVVIGDGLFLTKTGNFTDINWKVSPKFLKVELDPQGGTNFALMGTSRLQAVPFAYYANGVDAENVQGVLPASKGGTGVPSISALKGALQLDQVSNTSDINKPLSTATQTALASKVDKVDGKVLSTNDFTTAERTKLAAITGTNTGDQDLSVLATTTALATKANSTEVAAALATKVDKVQGKDLSTNDYTTAEKSKLAAITGTNTGDQDLSGFATTTALATKANAADVTTALAIKVDKAQGKDLSTNDYTTAEKTKLAAITGTNTGDQDLSGLATTAALNSKANTADVTTSLDTKVDKVQGKELSTNDYTTAEKTKLAAITGTNSGDQDLSGYATTTDLATKATITSVTTSLNLKEDVSKKSILTDLGGQFTSDALYPSQKAVKTYVDSQINNGGIADGSITSQKIEDGTLVNTDINASAGITFSKLNITKADIESLGIPGSDTNTTYTAGSGLTLSSNSFSIGSGAITSTHIADRAVTGSKLEATLTGYKNFVDGAGKVTVSANLTPDLTPQVGSIVTGGAAVWQSFVPGSSGKLGLIEFETTNPTSAFGMLPPTAYVEIYSGSGIGGTLLGRSNDVTISMMGRSWKAFDFNGSTIELFVGMVYTAKLIASTSNQDWVFGDDNLYNFGISNVSSTWDHNFKTSLKLFSNDVFLTESTAQNLYGNLISNATHTGEVTGSNNLTITDGAVTTSKLANGAVDLTSKVTGLLPSSNIADAAVTSDKVNNGAITSVKIANNAVDLASKVSGQLPSANIADGAITSAKIGGNAVDLTAQVTGLLPIANGGTGINSATANSIFAAPNGSSGSPSFRALVAADIPQNLSGYIQNAPSSAQVASIHINGSVISGSIQNTPIGSSTPNTGAFTTLSSSGNASIGGTLGVSGVATFTAAPILSSTTASRALFTNVNKEMVSNAITGTGNVVMSASPTLTGMVTLETITTTNDITINGMVLGRGTGNVLTNAVFGLGALTVNTTGEGNTAIGIGSLNKNSTGSYNTGLGQLTLNFNTGGNGNFAAGYSSLYRNTTGSNNFAQGTLSLFSNTTGSNNLAVGNSSLYSNTIGSNNIAIGIESMFANTSGSNNIAFGSNILKSNTTGSNNFAAGELSMFVNSSGNNNVGIGFNSLQWNSTGLNNFALGNSSLKNNTTGSDNISIGFETLLSNTEDNDNIAIGQKALRGLIFGSNNVAIGKNAGNGLNFGSNVIVIGADAEPLYNNSSDEITLGNSSISMLRSATSTITSLSDRRDKRDIFPIAEGLDFIKQLKPVTFTWDTRDKAKVGIKSAGFIAQDLLAIQKASAIGDNLDLVSENNPEKLEARYANLLPVMVKAIQEQQVLIEQLKLEIEALKKLVKE